MRKICPYCGRAGELGMSCDGCGYVLRMTDETIPENQKQAEAQEEMPKALRDFFDRAEGDLDALMESPWADDVTIDRDSAFASSEAAGTDFDIGGRTAFDGGAARPDGEAAEDEEETRKKALSAFTAVLAAQAKKKAADEKKEMRANKIGLAFLAICAILLFIIIAKSVGSGYGGLMIFIAFIIYYVVIKLGLSKEGCINGLATVLFWLGVLICLINFLI